MLANQENTNLKKRFFWRAIPLLIVCFFILLFYSGLPSGSLNFSQAYFNTTYGWSLTSITLPVTIGAFIAIPATFLLGTFIFKIGATKVLVPALLVVGVCQFLVGYATNLAILSIGLFFTKVLCVALLLAVLTYCTNWFAEWRGRVLGLVTIGPPFSAAIGVPLQNFGIESIGFPKTNAVIGIIVVALGIIASFVCRTTPEELGLYPDGKASKPEMIEDDISDIKTKWTPKKIFSNRQSWIIIIGFGFFIFIIEGIMPNFIIRMTDIGLDMKTTLSLFTAAALAGIALSYFYGWIDDKFGMPIASTILGIVYILGLTCLLFAAPTNMALLIGGTAGIASIIGGTPNLAPSSIAYVFGRRSFTHINRYLQMGQYVIPAFTLTFMGVIHDITGSFDLALKIMIGLSAVATILVSRIRKV